MFKVPASRALPQRADSEQTRRLILDTALTLFRERGFDATTMRDIAQAAGLSLGAAYYYFKSKDAIVGAYYHYVQDEHSRLARETFAATESLAERLRAAFHTKIDIVQHDRRLLRALFRYGGEPDHPLSWFGSGTRDQRDMSIAIFAAALDAERFPSDVQEAAPTLLWTLHMGVLLFFLYDSSAGHKRTGRLIDGSIEFLVGIRRLVTNPLLRPVRRRIFGILREADLLGPARSTAALRENQP